MNYRTWLIHRADAVCTPEAEPQVFGYMAWRNHDCLQAWYRRVADHSTCRPACDPERDVPHFRQRWARSRRAGATVSFANQTTV